MCNNYQLKQTTLIFFAQICPKRKLGFEIQKTNVGIRISILEISCVLIFRQNGQLLSFWAQICPKIRFWGRNFTNLSLDLESASLRYYVYQFSDKTNNSELLGPKLPKNGFWGRIFKNLSLDLESRPTDLKTKIPCVAIFCQNGQLWIFRPLFGEIAQLRAIFWFKYC